ncbi:MAG TPA: cytidylate kinase-like family protein [Terriglobales bacterium]|jgi:cytidylate kinase|nr:cytidylate kinase-like family protein [Terriglobales bacterium]
MFRIVTLEREFGSGGGGIACELARRLGWKLWDQQLTSEIAKRAQVTESAVALCDERVDSRLYRLAKAFWRGSYERSIPLADALTFDTDRMMAMVEEIMRRIAAEGNAVIVGRGGPFFLRDREDTFRVFTYAPHDEKIRRLLAMGKGREEAEDLVENVDKERMAYIKHYFNADWPVRCLYHLMINTAVGDENVIATILNGMQMLEAHPAETALHGVR